MDKGFQEWNSQIRGESKGKSEESRHETAGGHEQRNGKNVEMTQQVVRNADKAVDQHVVMTDNTSKKDKKNIIVIIGRLARLPPLES